MRQLRDRKRRQHGPVKAISKYASAYSNRTEIPGRAGPACLADLSDTGCFPTRGDPWKANSEKYET